ncbi:MAG TPA: biopolymer transporter ExbD [Tenuifilaceae bacterium]|nr:biopolymer transporter ExbD [Tenuifilaceae bacterium]HPI46015.1 biopolymer transporter ExbD [Tenuifilaceae bacterium]HPN22622.1 biopolymer transporter ExbD [Tenuifilaceae bacterium]
MARKVPEINASSMADIAFLLLIFFLMTTTMNVDTGLPRMLPPMPDPSVKQDDVEVKQRNVFTVLINKSDRLLVRGEPMDVSLLKEKTKEFVMNPNNDANMSEQEEKDVPMIGKFNVSKGVVSLQNDRGTSYTMYMKVQNELVAAYNELREDLSRSNFGKPYDKLSEDEKEAIGKAIPSRISEAEPKNIGGKK